MKKLFLVLCVVILFFGIVGCPSSDNPAAPQVNKVIASGGNDGGGSAAPVAPAPAPVPEPATLILLGAGLVGLAGVGRKKFFKKD